MNLTIDIGNTRIKYAVFEGDELLFVHQTDKLTGSIMAGLTEKFSINHVIIADVAEISPDIIEYFEKKSKLLILDEQTPLPFKNLYATPQTLGKDRIAAIAGAYAMYPEQNILVLDAGTAITYEFINAQGEYLGGGISPGVRLRFKALNTYTGRLPLIEPDMPDFLIGTSTKDAILSGVMNGMLSEMQGFIEKYNAGYPELKVILTGGDAFYFEPYLKNRIFAVPNLVLTGLNKILLHNAPNR